MPTNEEIFEIIIKQAKIQVAQSALIPSLAAHLGIPSDENEAIVEQLRQLRRDNLALVARLNESNANDSDSTDS